MVKETFRTHSFHCVSEMSPSAHPPIKIIMVIIIMIMREYDINPDLLDMSWSILKDRSVPAHAVFGENFEDQCGEGFHVNSRETRCF